MESRLVDRQIKFEDGFGSRFLDQGFGDGDLVLYGLGGVCCVLCGVGDWRYGVEIRMEMGLKIVCWLILLVTVFELDVEADESSLYHKVMAKRSIGIDKLIITKQCHKFNWN